MKTKLVYKLYEIRNGHIGHPDDGWGGHNYVYDEYDSLEDALQDVTRGKETRELVVLPTIVTSWESE